MAPDEDFGFVMTREGGLLYFHRDAMTNGDFDRLRRGDDVSYVEADSDTGPVATKIRVRWLRTVSVVEFQQSNVAREIQPATTGRRSSGCRSSSRTGLAARRS